MGRTGRWDRSGRTAIEVSVSSVRGMRQLDGDLH
jgi:hypothetical protein